MSYSFSDIINRIISYVKYGTGVTGEAEGTGNIDTRVGTVLRDGILAPNSFEFTNVYGSIDTVSANQGIITAASQSDTSLENLAANYGISRTAGGYATGIVRFFRYTQPKSDIVIPTGTSGTIVYTELADNRVPFHLIGVYGGVKLTPTSPTDSELGYYYVDAQVVCDTIGTIGNVAVGAISYVEVAGVDGCTNLNATTGGTDEQTNEELVATIAATARGNLGTRTGYESLVRTNFGSTDIKVIAPTDPESVRAQFGGAIDVVVLDEEQTPITDEEHIFVSVVGTPRIYPTFKPIMSVTNVELGEGYTAGVTGPVTLVEGVTGDYEVFYDIYSVNRRSDIDSSFIALHINSCVPTEPSTVTINYTIAASIAAIQDFLDLDDNKVLGSDVLVKAGIEIPVDITADIRIFSGYNSTTVTASISSALTTLFDAKLLDEDTQASDVISVITNVAGVDSVDLSTFVMAKATAPAIDLDEIVCNKQEYARLGAATITVVG